jgi:hypothetical protein
MFVNSSSGRSTLNVGVLAAGWMPTPVMATTTSLSSGIGVSPKVKPDALNDRVWIVVGALVDPCENVIDVGVD